MQNRLLKKLFTLNCALSTTTDLKIINFIMQRCIRYIFLGQEHRSWSSFYEGKERCRDTLSSTTRTY